MESLLTSLENFVLLKRAGISPQLIEERFKVIHIAYIRAVREKKYLENTSHEN